MKLVLRTYPVRDVAWGEATRLSDGVLHVDREALATHLVQADSRLAGVDLEIARPGDSCRIGPVFEVLQPRARLDGGSDYPGALGPMTGAGDGATGVLRGMAVTMINSGLGIAPTI